MASDSITVDSVIIVNVVAIDTAVTENSACLAQMNEWAQHYYVLRYSPL